jgi:hypothetical protein
MKYICKAIIIAACLLCALLCSPNANAQEKKEPAKAAQKKDIILTGYLRSRQEFWDWFGTSTGNGHYNFNGTILRLGATHISPTDDISVELQCNGLFGLPKSATMPAPKGQLGLGAAYHDASGNQETGFFLHQGFWRIKQPKSPGSSIRLGRFEFVDGMETMPADPTLAWLKRERIAHRLLGNFAWSHIGRSFDGIQVTGNGAKQNTTLLFAMPTRGVFDLHGMDELEGVNVAYGAYSVPIADKKTPGDLRLLGAHYEDTRTGVTKTDNRRLATRTADKQGIRVDTLGGHYLKVIPTAFGKLDALMWGAWQTGQWGAQTQDAYAFAGEVGLQPKGIRWKPWIRAGYYEASGDGNAADGNHGTFFPMLPTPRIYARFPFYSETNLKDAFVQLILRPTPKLTARLDYRQLALADTHDLWYAGGGAFQEAPNFGYAGRPSGGFGSLAKMVDLSLDYNLRATSTISLYFAAVEGGNVVQSIYPGKNASFGYVEFVQRW